MDCNEVLLVDFFRSLVFLISSDEIVLYFM